eukprot:TRINITY_DN31618_c0_g1_i1.p1 TRINITY_DN31618_c0_g1~~TRINITY_DN31618_c0_g1_i1.p1  ORF type:complete len:537 (+),score=127.57 TRINITY_DN31618_c0_g1_i1:105-1613(+)
MMRRGPSAVRALLAVMCSAAVAAGPPPPTPTETFSVTLTESRSETATLTLLPPKTVTMTLRETVAPPTPSPPTPSPTVNTTAAPTTAPTPAPPTPAPPVVPVVTLAPESSTSGRSILIKIKVALAGLTRSFLVNPLFNAIASYTRGRGRPVSVKEVVVLFVCPVSAFSDGRYPSSGAGVEGCMSGMSLPQGRSASVLQGGVVDAFAEFDVVPVDSASFDQARNDAFNAMAGAATSADLAVLQPDTTFLVESRNTSVTPLPAYVLPVTAAPSDDDDGMSLWLILFIVAASLCLCLLLVALVLFLKGRKKNDSGRDADKQADKEEMHAAPQHRDAQLWENPNAPVAGKLGEQQQQDQQQQEKQPQQQQWQNAGEANNRQQEAPAPQPYQQPPPPPPPQQQQRQPVVHSPSPQKYSEPEVDPSPYKSANQRNYDSEIDDSFMKGGSQSIIPPDYWLAGDLVDAKYGDDWYPAQVVEQQEDGLYIINWTDGTMSRDIPGACMRVRC